MVPPPWLGLLLSTVLVPLPEDWHCQPGATIALTRHEDESDADFAQRLDAHVTRLRDEQTLAAALGDPALAQIEALQGVAESQSWVRDHLHLDVDERAGLIRVWIEEGSEAHRLAVTEAIINSYSARLKQELAEAERAVTAAETELATLVTNVQRQQQTLDRFAQNALNNPRILQTIEALQRSLTTTLQTISAREATVVEETRKRQLLLGVSIHPAAPLAP